jgi:hypothetical protein
MPVMLPLFCGVNFTPSVTAPPSSVAATFGTRAPKSEPVPLNA